MATPNPTRELLARAHSPDSTNRLYTEKIQHRPLHLRPTSPPPSVLSARDRRRQKRQQEKDRQKLKPKPLSSRQRRALGLHDIPPSGQTYATYEPLANLWQGYAREVLAGDVYARGPGPAAKLAAAEFTGAEVEVVRSACPSRVGIAGIVARDRRHVFEVVTKKRGVKTVPKEGTTFRVQVEVEATSGGPGGRFVFEILGDQMRVRSADRANRKFKAHFLRNL